MNNSRASTTFCSREFDWHCLCFSHICIFNQGCAYGESLPRDLSPCLPYVSSFLVRTVFNSIRKWSLSIGLVSHCAWCWLNSTPHSSENHLPQTQMMNLVIGMASGYKEPIKIKWPNNFHIIWTCISLSFSHTKSHWWFSSKIEATIDEKDQQARMIWKIMGILILLSYFHPFLGPSILYI